MAYVLAITNQKGGVGKTTTAVNLSAALALTRRRVLMVDFDPQGNATTGSGLDKHALEASVTECLLDGMPLAQAIVASPAAGYHVLPANADLTAAEVGLQQQEGGALRLRTLLGTVREHYDYVLVDCPPSLNMLTLNALAAADSVLIPLQCEYYALEGLTALLDTIEQVRATLNPRLHVEGILRTMFDARNRLANQVSEQLLEHFGDRVYRTIVPRNVRLAEAPSHGLPVLHYDRNSRGALAYLALAGELVRRTGVPVPPQGAPEKAMQETHHGDEETRTGTQP
ncbi:MAG: ParA family protein [Gammaproteobacteria bacterium]|nr:MAG: ParA family protein [Gammaproteobacteria bacterium]